MIIEFTYRIKREQNKIEGAEIQYKRALDIFQNTFGNENDEGTYMNSNILNLFVSCRGSL